MSDENQESDDEDADIRSQTNESMYDIKRLADQKSDFWREREWAPDHSTPNEFLRRLIILEVMKKHDHEIKEHAMELYPDSPVMAERR